ncbi:MAG: 4-phosphoerythronate dehydrogenase [Muribaculaceae bacterium]|nr:4-phosphoerythronate dehydrogenase [Muribaculaceae bacterium]
MSSNLKIVADRNIPFLEGRLPEAELIRLPATEIDSDSVRDADALIIRTRTRCDSLLLKGSKVKLIATATIGTDHIDLSWCEANGITVRNAPGSNAPGVALYVWSNMLRYGFDPSTDTLGVIGCGNVGSIVAQWAERLGARVLASDPPRKDRGESDREYLPLEEVLAKSDAVTLHTPLTHAGAHPTFHLIDKASIRHLKPGAIFVNAARGEVAETDALLKAIEEGRISRAIIDTWEGEPSIDPRLLELAATATTHIAGYSVEGKQRATRMALEAVADTLHIPVDLSGLQGAYKDPAILTQERIIEAYDPAGMTSALKADPAEFETLRNSYSLHREIL